MNQCKDEIAEIASKTIPGINNYEDYYNWTAEKRGSLAFINECYEKIYTNVAEAALSPNDPSEEVAEILMAHILREEYCKAIVEARLNNPDKPFAECLSHEQIMTIYNKRNLMKNEIQDKIGRLYAGNHEALIEALPSLITGGSLSGKNIEVELTNGEVKIKNAPTKEEVTRRSLYLKADKQSAAERFSAIFTEAEEAQINVHLGSKEYDRAQEALKDVRDRFGELEQLNKDVQNIKYGPDVSEEEHEHNRDLIERRDEKLVQLKGLVKTAETAVDLYIARKRRQGKLGPDAGPKTVRRVNIMKNSKEALNLFGIWLEESEAENDLNNQLARSLDFNAKNGTGNADDQYLDNIINAMENENPVNNEIAANAAPAGRRPGLEEKEKTTQGIEKLAVKGAIKSIEVLENIVSGAGELSLKDKRMARLAVASFVFCDMLEGREGDEIRSGMPQDMESYKAQVKKIADTQEFKDIMADKFDGKKREKLLTDKRATKELLEEFREKTKPARKRSNSIAGKNPVKNDGENKDGKEGIIKRSNSMKIGK